MISLETRLSKNKDIAVQDHFEETFVLNLAKSTVHCLGDIETDIWNAIDGNRSAADIVRKICDEYEVDEATARADVLEFLSDLAGNGLIDSCSETSS